MDSPALGAPATDMEGGIVATGEVGSVIEAKIELVVTVLLRLLTHTQESTALG